MVNLIFAQFALRFNWIHLMVTIMVICAQIYAISLRCMTIEQFSSTSPNSRSEQKWCQIKHSLCIYSLSSISDAKTIIQWQLNNKTHKHPYYKETAIKLTH